MGWLIALVLASACPPSFVEGEGGLCHLETRYLQSGSVSGLQKPGPIRALALDSRKIELGRHLFFDPILSKNNSVSCASCHAPEKGLSDGRSQSIGVLGTRVLRSAPPLWNLAFYESFFWDGRSATLESQLDGPLLSEDEMGATKQGIESRLNKSAKYRKLFAQAYPKSPTVRYSQVKDALAEFERSLVSLDSPYDQFAFGEPQAMEAHQLKGFNIFRSFVTRCTECHAPPLFTTFQHARIGAPDKGETLKDLGVGHLTGNIKHEGVFRIPSLRNIALTAPYMHSGVFKSLSEVIDFYDLGGGRALEAMDSPYTHWHIVPMGLARSEKKALIAFLNVLTDVGSQPVPPKTMGAP